jgi:5-methylcytosine-specific restriction endonuclease McrA
MQTEEERKEKKRARMRIYARKYYTANKDKILKAAKDNEDKLRKYRKEYYLANKDQIRAAQAEWRAENPKHTTEWCRKNKEKVRAYSAKYYLKNREEILAKGAEYAKKNKDKAVARTLAYYKRHPERPRALQAKRRARLQEALCPSANQAIIRTFYDAAQRISACIGIPFHVDHVTPISRGGLHHQANLQLLPGAINSRKSNKVQNN